MDQRVLLSRDILLSHQQKIPKYAKRVDALALCSPYSVAWFDASRQQIHCGTWSDVELVLIKPLHVTHDVNTLTQPLVNITQWKMASNAPVVVGVLQDGKVVIFRHYEPPTVINVNNAVEICRISPFGVTAVVTCEDRLLLLHVETGMVEHMYQNGVCADVDECGNIAVLMAPHRKNDKTFVLRVNDVEENIVNKYPEIVPCDVCFVQNEKALMVQLTLYKTTDNSLLIHHYECRSDRLMYKRQVRFADNIENFTLPSGHWVSHRSKENAFVIFSKSPSSQSNALSITRPVALNEHLMAYMPNKDCIRVVCFTR